MICLPCIISLKRDFIVALRRGNVYTRLKPAMAKVKIRHSVSPSN